MRYSIEEVYSYRNNNINLEELSNYLEDIFQSIGEEITKITERRNQYVENTWRHKANPCLMQALAKIDKDELLINYELNKITNENYKNIFESLKNKTNINDDKNITNFIIKLFDKILRNEQFLDSHMNFLMLLKNESTSPQLYVKEITKYYKTHMQLNNEKQNNEGKLKIYKDYYIFGLIIGFLLNHNNILDEIKTKNDISQFVTNINSLFEWEPINMDLIELNIYILLGIFSKINDSNPLGEEINNNLKKIMDEKKITLRLKFHVLNILDEKNDNQNKSPSPPIENKTIKQPTNFRNLQPKINTYQSKTYNHNKFNREPNRKDTTTINNKNNGNSNGKAWSRNRNDRNDRNDRDNKTSNYKPNSKIQFSRR